MEFLVEFDIHIPAAASEAEVKSRVEAEVRRPRTWRARVTWCASGGHGGHAARASSQ